MVDSPIRAVSGEKQALRERVRDAVSGLAPEYVEQSDKGVAARVTELPEYARAARVFAYWSVGRECDTRGVIARAMAEGKTVALPISYKGGIMEFQTFSGALVSGLLGIPVPDGGERAEPDAGDVMLVPALCCDADGFRLGHGGGYYDRYLAEHECFTVCLCRERLLMKKVPRDWNDLAVNAVITEERLVRI